MKKKQRFLFPLLMAIVMMVVSPGRAWADCLRVYDNDHDLLGEYTFVNDQVFVDLGVGQYIELVLSNNERAECYPTCNALITSDGIVDSDNEETIDGLVFDMIGSRSLLVDHAGRYIVTLSNRSFDEFEMREDVWVENLVDEFTGYDTDGNPIYTPMDNGYYENRTVGYSVNTANATLTFREVPTFTSLEDLLAAGQDYDAVNVTIDDEVMVAMLNPEGAYMVALKNNMVLLQAPAPDPALNWPSGGRVTGTLTNVRWDRVDNLLHSDDASLWSNLTYTPGVVKEYNSIDKLLADDVEQGTTVSVKINNKIAAIQNMDAGMSLILLEKANGEEGIGLIGLIDSDSDLEAGGNLSGTLTNVTYGLMNDVTPALMALSGNILAVLDYTAPAGGSESSDVASVTIDETTTGYADFQDALTAAKTASSATLTLLQDINRENSMDFYSGSNVTLDLNGHSITGNLSYSLIYIANGGTLTITDMSSEKSGYVINNGDRAINTEDGSTIYIQAGTFCSHNHYAISIYSNNVALSGGRFITENGSRAIDINTGSVLADGYFFLDSNGDKLYEIYNIKDVTVGKVYAASVTTTNGTVQYEDLGSALSAAKAASSATVTLRQNVSLPTNTGLTFDEGNIILDLNGKSLSSSQTDAINVNGGTLTITDNSSKKSGQVSTSYGTPVSATSGSLTIHAGTFTSNVHSALIVNGGNGNLTASVDGGRFVYNGYGPIGAVSVTGMSALADGYAYYKTGSITQLSDVTSGQIYMDQSGPVTDVTVDVVGRTYEDLYTVIGDLNDGDNSINISAVDGYVDGNPSHYNIYRITAPTDGKITVTIPGNGEDWIAADLFDANFYRLTYDYDYDDFSVECQATEGSVYYLGVREYSGSEMGNYTITVNLPKNIDEMTLEDGIAYEGVDAGRKVLSFTYQRTFSESQVGKWQAYYVPFQMPIDKLTEAGIDVACINNFHEYTDEEGNVLDRELEIKMLTSGTLKENWPYLIRPKTAGEKNIVLENAKLADDGTYAYGAYASCSSVTTRYYFYGTYQPMTDLYSDGYMFLSGGTLQTAANDEQVLKAQRWYLEISENYGNQLADDDDDDNPGGGGPVAVKSMNIRVIGEDDANGIEEIRVVSTKVAKNSSAGIYDIQGRKVSAPVKGINIIRQEDGSVRKVMVK